MWSPYTSLLFLGLLNLVSLQLQAQPYDLLIKGGEVIDPKNKIHRRLDVAVTAGVISRVDENISAVQSKKVIDARGFFVVPGLIDLHTHVFVGSQPDKFADGINSLSPDDFSFRSGITTMVDAGTSGAGNFNQFRQQVIDKSQTRVLAFLNIAAFGLSGKPEQETLDLMDVSKTVQVVRQYPDLIVGIKIGHYEQEGWQPFDRARQAAELTGTPLFVECHLPYLSLEEQLQRMRPGDILTHAFEKVSERAPVVDESGNLRPFVREAQQRGILFDVGHGGAGFWFSQALPALQQGLAPHSMGSDLHRFSRNAGMKSMLNIMSKYLAMGLSLDEVILRATWNPAQAIHRTDLGSLTEGHVADIALLSLQKGKFGFVDAGGQKISGNRKLEAEMTIRSGKVVWDLNGLAAVPFK